MRPTLHDSSRSRKGDDGKRRQTEPPEMENPMIEIVTVNVGTPVVVATVGAERVWSGIRKHAVPSTEVLWLSEVNLSGDGQADLSVHGGVDKAVYAYPSEHLSSWSDELGQTFGPAPFGENLSTLGALEGTVCIGDVWAWGDAVLQVTQPRWPCFKLAIHRERPDIQGRLRASARTGWYLRVLRPGEVPAAGPITVAATNPLGLTVLDAHEAMSDVHLDDPAAARAVADHPALAEQWRAPLLNRIGRHAR
jgi:MOSC domain-containing protein YiiM